MKCSESAIYRAGLLIISLFYLQASAQIHYIGRNRDSDGYIHFDLIHGTLREASCHYLHDSNTDVISIVQSRTIIPHSWIPRIEFIQRDPIISRNIIAVVTLLDEIKVIAVRHHSRLRRGRGDHSRGS